MTEQQTTTLEPRDYIMIAIKLKGARSKDVYELINYYRMLKQETWYRFIMNALVEYIGLENEMIANAVRSFLLQPKPPRAKSGRPKGIPVTAEQRKRLSDHMRNVWAEKKRVQELINLEREKENEQV